ncbi:MAG: MBL fold metallo-hydrolase [Candidatus Micrarchaeia archaeon]
MNDFIFFDGYNTVGGNKIYVHGVLLDFGLNISVFNKFFDPFLRPRVAAGIWDLLRLHLIPPINIYRSDLVPPDVELPDIDVKAVLVSHAHIDHIGGVPYLAKHIPIIASKDTLKLAQYYQDVASGEYLQWNKREFVERDDGVYISRSSAKKELEQRLYITEEKGWIDDVLYYMMPVSHSVPGSVGYYIETPYTSLFYTGDFNLHTTPRDIDSFRDISTVRPKYLIIEGTNITTEKRGNEDDLFPAFEKLLRSSNGIVFFDFTSKNINRFKIFKQAVDLVGKNLVITAEMAYLLQLLEENIWTQNNVYILSEKKVTSPSWFKKIDGNFITYKEINKNTKDFVISANFYDVNNLLDIDLTNGIYIYSRSEPFDELSEISFDRVMNWATELNLQIASGPDLHVSGHAYRNEIIDVVDIVNPQYIIPVHTNTPETFKEIFKDKVLLPEEIHQKERDILLAL